MTSKHIRFAKMHGLGNDFMVIDAINQAMDDSAMPVIALGHRRTGVGFDQLLLIKPSSHADFFCRIFNADGSEAEQCGNGLRCVARYVYENKLTAKKSFAIETIAGIYPAAIDSLDYITITMGAPSISESRIHLSLQDGQRIDNLCVLSVGNPHAILKVSSIASIDMNITGSKLSTHPYFPSGANIGFMEVVTPHHIRLRTYERGAGETFACGSNACAAVVAGITHQWLANQVDVEFKLGKLSIRWDEKNQPIQMSGPADLVYVGEIGLNHFRKQSTNYKAFV